MWIAAACLSDAGHTPAPTAAPAAEPAKKKGRKKAGGDAAAAAADEAAAGGGQEGSREPEPVLWRVNYDEFNRRWAGAAGVHLLLMHSAGSDNWASRHALPWEAGPAPSPAIPVMHPTHPPSDLPAHHHLPASD